jgi:hypothetical protein
MPIPTEQQDQAVASGPRVLPKLAVCQQPSGRIDWGTPSSCAPWDSPCRYDLKATRRDRLAGADAITAPSHLTGQLGRRILLHTMVNLLYLLVEAVGCPTVCRHCWAQGTPYQAMPFKEVSDVLEAAHGFCADHGLGFGAYPMHELAAHPQAAELLRLFADHVGAGEFEPLSTTGVPLATRRDWRELLAAVAALGTTTVWVAFHGLGPEHDRQVNRSGAWAETCLAVQRVHAAGLRAGANVFVTSANAGQAGLLLRVLERLEVDEMSWEPATFYPTVRGRHNERLRPQLADLLPIADQVRQRSLFHRDAWANLASHTEAGWRRRALAGDWPIWKRHDGELLELVCRANLDVHLGTAGRPRERFGNLGADGAAVVFGQALAHGPRSADALWFGHGRLPELAELADRHGDGAGQGVHFSADSVRYLWLDRARRPQPTSPRR